MFWFFVQRLWRSTDLTFSTFLFQILIAILSGPIWAIFQQYNSKTFQAITYFVIQVRIAWHAAYKITVV